jgi:hypothetical protein
VDDQLRNPSDPIYENEQGKTMRQQLLTPIGKTLRLIALFTPCVDFKINMRRMTQAWIPGKLYL